MIASTTVDYVAGRALVRFDADDAPPARRPRRRAEREPGDARLLQVRRLLPRLAGRHRQRGRPRRPLPRASRRAADRHLVLHVQLDVVHDRHLPRQVQPARSFLHYAAFVSMFPHLIAGPIVRYSTIDDPAPPAHARASRGSSRRSGMFFLSCGLVKKLLIADTLAPHVDRLFARSRRPRAGRRLGGGARLHAPALLRLLRLLRHGRRPRVPARLPLPAELRLALQGPATSPTSGAAGTCRSRSGCATTSSSRSAARRSGRWRTLRNLGVTMFLGGLWHGAAWTFVVWGLVHGVFLIVHNVLQRAGLTPPSVVVNRAITFACVAAAFVIFRAPDLHVAGDVLSAMAGLERRRERGCDPHARRRPPCARHRGAPRLRERRSEHLAGRAAPRPALRPRARRRARGRRPHDRQPEPLHLLPLLDG